MTMEVIPAIDLKGGRCVRLYQGDYGRETVYSEDPAAMAGHWQSLGAPRLHLVDLDGAAKGEPCHLALIGRMAAAVKIPVQVGGGIRCMETIRQLLDLGVQRVILGTAASVPDAHQASVQLRVANDDQDRAAINPFAAASPRSPSVQIPRILLSADNPLSPEVSACVTSSPGSSRAAWQAAENII